MQSQKIKVPRHMKEAEFVSTLKNEDEQEPKLDEEIKKLSKEKKQK